MHTGSHTVIRNTDPDDSVLLWPLYGGAAPRSALLDQRREPIRPTRAELREIFTKTEPSAQFFTVENMAGELLGQCALRGIGREQAYAEATLLLFDEALAAAAPGAEVAAFLKERAFRRLGLVKLVTHCLDTEGTMRAYWAAHGFVPCGTQRDVLWAKGRWHNQDVLSCFAPEYA
jgi:RimJ/RimL family protein N-acetyltransferase